MFSLSDSVPDCMLDFASSCSTVHRYMLALDLAVCTLWKRKYSRRDRGFGGSLLVLCLSSTVTSCACHPKSRLTSPISIQNLNISSFLGFSCEQTPCRQLKHIKLPLLKSTSPTTKRLP